MITISGPAALVLAGVTAVAGAAGGVLATRHHFDATVRFADGYATASQVSLSTSDWSYHVPLDVPWTDSEGAWHESGRPECLRASGPIRTLRFATVTAKVDGTTWRPVVWVDCRPLLEEGEGP